MTEQVSENVQEGTPVPEQQAEETPQELPPPPVERNLFWDDLRIGLGIVRVGVVILLVGMLCNVLFFTGFFSIVTILVGGFVTVIGLHTCSSAPKESGGQQLATAADGCALICLIAVILNNGADGYRFFYPHVPDKNVSSLCLLLGTTAHLLFAMTLVRAATFLKARSLTKNAELYFQVTLAFSLLFLLFSLSCLYTPRFDELMPFKVVLGILIVGSSVGLWQLVGQSRRVLALLYQGHTLEEADAPVEAPEEEPVTAEGEVVHDQPMAPVPQPYFADEEWGQLHKADRGMGGLIVKLMTGIFSIGVFIYVIVLWLVSTD